MEALFHTDLGELIKTLGYIGLFFVIFAESGLFFGFFLPGDSVLFTAGFLASQGWFNIWVLVPLMMIAAVGGDSAGFYTGEKFGPWLTRRKSSLLFSKKNLDMARDFFDKHGGKALILARFMPAVRTFVPIAAGMAGMHYKKFISYNVVGGLIWGAGMTLGGYFLGQLIPNVDHYLLPIIFVIIIISVLPGVIHMRGDIKAIIVKLLARLP